ncbi:MAG: hypothetical protein K2H64_02110 [Desulfovibrio sp.]|nr:hypothetical protein [Desulfovibrio sp.]
MTLLHRSKGKYLVAFIALCLCAILCGESRAAREHIQGATESGGDPVPLLPFLEYYLDDSMSMDIDEAASPGVASSYKPLVLDELPLTEAVTWLRFTISALEPGARAAAFLLDMGQGAPGVPLLYTPEKNELSGALEWQENLPAQRNIFLLPEAGHEPITCYIRIDGLPGVWFSPMIRTPQNAASNWGSLARTGAILALAIVMLFCLPRGLGERGQWRIWTSLFVAVALAQALLGMPPVSGATSMRVLGAVLAPGIALMLVPHIGRHLLRGRENSRAIDIQLFILSFPGAAIALLPLAPGWTWMFRWLDLWPLGCLIFVPTALGAWLMGINGSRRFLLGCLIPPFFTAIALAGLFTGFPAYLLSSGPLWGVALAAIALASVSSQWDSKTKSKNTPASETQENSPARDNSEIVILEHPLDDPNLRIVSPNFNIDSSGDGEQTQIPVPGRPDKQGASDVCERLEKEMREPIDELVREGVALGHCSLPPAARDHAEKMIQSAKSLAEILVSGPIYQQPEKSAARPGNFNLQKLLREASDSMSALAENSGAALSWHMPPHLEQWFYGDYAGILQVISLLLESSIRASSHGAVRLSVKRAPDNSDPYYIQFTVSDDGQGTPPLDRSSLALAKAWELAGRNSGYLDMESGRHGTTITFSLRLAPAREDEEPDEEEGSLHVVVACEDEGQRAEIVNILRNLPARISEAANAREIAIRQNIDPAPLLITAGRLALPSAGDSARDFAALAQKAGYSRSFILAITPDTSQWPLLKTSGFTHAMTEPIDAESLLDTVKNFTRILLRSKEVEPAGDSSVAELRLSSDQQSDRDSSPESRVARDEDFSPSMIVDQNLDINYNFDTPDWLNRESAGQERPASPDELSPDNGPEREKPKSFPWQNRPFKKEIADNHIDPAEEHDSSPTDSGEWVGEPRPREKNTPNSSPTREKEREASEKISLETGNANIVANVAKDEASRPDANAGSSGDDAKKDDMAIVDPVISEFVETLRQDMRQVIEAFERRDAETAERVTEKIAKDADNFGFRQLAKLAQCVRRAASANDFSAMTDLLPDLSQAAERYCIHLTQKYQ